MLTQPFFQITLPLMITFVASIWAATWMQNKRIDEISKRIDDVIHRLDGIETRLKAIEEKLVAFDHRVTILEAAKWH
jgi:DNA anti-recombination protein RmuC